MSTETRMGIAAVGRGDGERERLWFIDSLATVHVRGEDTDGAMAMVELYAPSGSMTPLHVHHREEETFYVMDGEMEFHIGDQPPLRVAAGGCVVAPRGVPHTFKVTSDEPARTLVVASPAGFERFVEAVSDPAAENTLPPADAPPDMPRIMAAASEAGIDILGPPGALPNGTRA